MAKQKRLRFNAFDRVEDLEEQDQAAAKLRRRLATKDVSRARAARSQTKIYGHLMETRILLQRTLHQVSSNEKSYQGTHHLLIDQCDTLLKQLLPARKKMIGWSKHDENVVDDNNLQSEYDQCQQQWKDVLNRRHQDLRLHAGLASLSKSQFRVLDSSFWQQVESTVAHEEMRQQSASTSSAPEFDDARVYQQMLKDFLVLAASTSSGATETTLQKWRKPQPKKKVDRKASKGRKIRYMEIPKLVNFTFPISRSSKSNLDEDEWFHSLFGGAGKNTNSSHPVTTDNRDDSGEESE